MRTTPRGYKTPEADDILPQSAGHIRETLEAIDGEQTGQDAALAGHGGRLDGHEGRLDGLDAALLSLASDLTGHSVDSAAHAAAIAAQRPWATVSEAEAGVAADTVMSPARVAAAIAALTPDVAGQIDGRLDNVMMVSKMLAVGAYSGTFTAGAWRTRNLDTVEMNNITGAWLSANVITLPAGLYCAIWHGTAYQIWRHCTRLYNVTTGESYLGLPSYAESLDTAVGHAVFEITGSCQFRLEHFCNHTVSNEGFGTTTGLEIPARIADVLIKKLR